MSKRLELNITETETFLKQAYLKEQDHRQKERLHMLYLHKSGAETERKQLIFLTERSGRHFQLVLYGCAQAKKCRFGLQDESRFGLKTIERRRLTARGISKPTGCMAPSLQLDRAGFHTLKKLEIPDNIGLVFQPAHCPKLNPIEPVWDWIQSKISFEIYPSLEALKNRVAEILKEANKEIFKSITLRDSILNALQYAGMIS